MTYCCRQCNAGPDHKNKIATEQPLTKPNLFDYNGFENLVEMDKLNLKYMFTYAMTRVLGLKKEFQF